MGKIILYSIPLSPPGRAVQLVAAALGLDVDLRIVDLQKKEHLTPEFLKLNPQHTIPTVVDGETVLWDSHAIIIYLVQKYGKKNDPLYPDDIVTRAKIHQHLHFDSGVAFARYRFLLEPIFYHGAYDLPEEKVEYIYKTVELLESVLQETPYLVGNNLTLADLSVITSISSIVATFPGILDKYPKVQAWIARLEKLPYYAEVNQKGASGLGDFFRELVARNQAASN